YSGHDKSPTIRKIFRDIYADDYMEDVDQNSYMTRTDLQRMLQYLEIDIGDKLVDLGCGRGGPCMWIARETGAVLTGIDISGLPLTLPVAEFLIFPLIRGLDFMLEVLRKPDCPMPVLMQR
ncbi:MAG: hypothetical protein ABFD76_00165, partial [Smithella sp.]